ncbi:hypothetical protein PV729_26560 [Streptomyces europaeiscabiei]|uniref:Uncharacterized protein n=1 Tax=Streptomyces europaeiscabiei TaxID=146819 RepID=A0ABU4NSH0_9ACTN|nr:hypothetical protein [Streptomyces europaeiscabiei]MDX3555285.1 hypothetical protein [Streptomyces europaeiscabiei]MDX3705299.1 hypothetical protein [Streptomyces europaeiscabiei]
MSSQLPDRLLPHEVVIAVPASSTDSYGNTVYDYGAGAARTTVAAWLQQDQRTLVTQVGADPLEERWLMVTNASPVPRRARIEWAGHPEGPVVFELDGRPGPAYNPLAMAAAASTAPHHTELTLKIVNG